MGKGTKTIPVGQITAVQVKPASRLVNGFIALTVSGGVERRSKFGSQTTDAGRDENSVVFTWAQRDDFEQLRVVVEAAMIAPTPNVGVQPDAVDQLRRLAELRDGGVVSAAEFDTAKARLLGSVA